MSLKLLIGLLALVMLTGANPPQKEAPQREGSEEAAPSPPAAQNNTPEANIQQGECPYGDNYENAQLCVEWRSATAAEEAAELAAAANWIDGIVAIFTVLGFLALIWTLILTRSQLRIVREDRDSARVEAAQMREKASSSLSQATRSADAMGDVADQFEKSLKVSSQIADAQKMAMRAFVTVTIEEGFFQDRSQNIKFFARPMIKNSGHTSAKNLRWAVHAGILPDPPDEGYEFTFPEPQGGGGFIPPQDGRSIIASLTDFIEDDRSARILRRGGESFYVWGKILYEDVFGNERETKFGACIFWVFAPDGTGKLETIYLADMNDAT